jgi:serine/threonine protein kinase
MPICPKCRHPSPELGGKCPYDEYYFVPEETANDSRKDPMIGTIIADKYIIIALINEGGMGAVYRALQTPIGREVALKVLRAELRESEQGGDRFIREAKAVARLQHPNIINLHDFGFDHTKHPYMVMEYAPGVSMTRWLLDERLTFERILHVIRQILSALQEAHECGIVHRDLKPENMIIAKSGTDRDFVKLLDFGIARVINEGATKSLTREGEVFGTPHYMAPEQARGEKNIGPPADVYAVGIMLFEMLTGEQPYDAPTPLAVLFQHINEPLPPVTPRAGVSFPPAVAEVVRIATAKEVKDRYQSSAEFLKALEQAAPHGSVSMHAVLNAVIQDSLNPHTLVPGSQPISTQQLAARAPIMTPTGPLRNDVAVYDPDPSIEVDAPHLAAAPVNSSERKLTAILLTGVVGLLAFLSVLFLYKLSVDPAGNVPIVDAATGSESPTPPDLLAEVEPKVEPEVPVKDEPEAPKVDPATEVEKVEPVGNVEKVVKVEPVEPVEPVVKVEPVEKKPTKPVKTPDKKPTTAATTVVPTPVDTKPAVMKWEKKSEAPVKWGQ